MEGEPWRFPFFLLAMLPFFLYNLHTSEKNFVNRDANHMGEKKTKTLASEHPEIAAEWHSTKNGELTPDEVLSNTGKVVWWKCAHGHEWQASVSHRTRPRGCSFCSNRRVWKGYNDLASQFPDIAAEWHPTKNGDLTPDEVVATTSKKAWWRCPHGHEWQTPVVKRTVRGHGCHQCSNQAVIPGENDLISQAPDIAELFHPTLNADVDLADLAVFSNKKVWWQCDSGYDHPYMRTVYNQVHAKGKCPFCCNRRILPGFNDLMHNYPELMSEWDFEKNAKEPYEISASSSYVAYWKCEQGHEWTASVASRTKHDRIAVCPTCKKDRTSFSEQCIIFYIKIHCHEEIKESAKLIPDRNYEVDAYLPARDLAVEYNGTFWHKGKIASDTEKRDLLFSQGIETIYVYEPGGEVIEGSAHHTMDDFDVENLERACRWVLERLGVSADEIDIDIERDRLDIMRSYKTPNIVRQFACKHPELLEMWDYRKNNEQKVFPYLFTSTSEIAAWWKCPECEGEWERSVTRMIANSSCPHCGISAEEIYEHRKYMNEISVDVRQAGKTDGATLNSKFSLAEKLPELMRYWDDRKNEPVDPMDLPYNSKGSFHWICIEGHSFEAEISEMASDSAACCPYCSGHAEYNVLSYVRPDLLGKWDCDKNGNLTPDDVTCGSSEMAWWVCEEGHSFQAQVSSVASEGYHCPICSGQLVDKDVNSLSALRPDIAEKWDHELNGDLTPDMVSVGSSRNVWWKCENGFDDHAFEKPIRDMTKIEKSFCPYCSNQKVLRGFNDLATVVPHIAKQWNYDKNGDLVPSDVTFVSSKKVHWKCEKCGYEWMATVGNRVERDSGCPSCSASLNAKSARAKRFAEEDRETILDIACKDPSSIADWESNRIEELHWMIGVDHEILRMKYLYYDMTIDDMADDSTVPRKVMEALLDHEGILGKTEQDVRHVRDEIEQYDLESRDKGGVPVREIIDRRIMGKQGVPDISKDLRCSKSWLNAFTKKLGVSSRKLLCDKEKVPATREWLEEEHCNKMRSFNDIAKELGVNEERVAGACRAYRLPYLGGNIPD